MGFQYELGEQFAKSLGVKLKIKVAKTYTTWLKDFLQAKAISLPTTCPSPKNGKTVWHTAVRRWLPIRSSYNVQRPRQTVERCNGTYRKGCVRKPGKYYERLVNLDKELGGGIHIHKVSNDSITIEDLIMQVSQGKIPYTVADNDVARLNTTYYPNLNIGLSISFDQRASWAVRKDCPQLAEAANKWHEKTWLLRLIPRVWSGILKLAKLSHTLLFYLCEKGNITLRPSIQEICTRH